MKRKPSKALRDIRRAGARRQAVEAGRLRRAARLETENRMNITLARNNIVDCGLCGGRFWPWDEIKTPAGIPVHAICESDWIAGRLPALDGANGP